MNNLIVHKQFTTEKNDLALTTGDGENSIQDLLEYLEVPEDSYDYVHVYVGDIYVEKGMYKYVRPKNSAEVRVIMLPQGGDEILPIIAMIAISVVAGPAGLALASGQAGFLATTYAIGITIAGSLLVNALFPPPEAPEVTQTDGGSPALTIAGSRNSFPYDKPVPRVYGTVKFFPPHAAQPYTISEGGDQYLYMVFDIGYGNVAVTDLKIGDTDINDYNDVETNIVYSVTSSSDLKWFTNDIDIETVNANMEDGAPATIRTTPTEFNFAQFDLFFGGGLYAKNNEGAFLDETVNFSCTIRNESDVDITTDFTLQSQKDVTGVAITETGLDFSIKSNIEDGFSLTFMLEYIGVSTKPDFIKIEISRTTSTNVGTVRVNNCSYTTLRTYRIGKAFKQFRLIDTGVYVSHTMIEMRIKATDQLNGVLDNFNCIASARLRKWDGSTFTAPTLTDNPAWVYADILTGSMNQRAKDDSKINWDELKNWADFCDTLAEGQNGVSTKAHTCNFVLDYSATLYKLLSEVAAIGRASPDIYDDKYSVIWDDVKTTKVQLFTNMNTSDFNSSRLYTEIPDAVKISFRDPDSDWQMRELVVYNDGFDVNNAKVFEDIKAPMLTSSNEAYREGRYWLKQAALRKENITFKTDLEWLECKRGDLVGMQMDVIKTGGTVARVKSVNGQVITVDTDPAMNGNGVLYFELRKTDGVIVSGPVAFYSINSPLEVDIGINGASAGDMIVFNDFNKETYDLLIRKIDVNPDQTANITCVEYAPELFDLASDPVPVYTPSIGNIYNPNSVPSILQSLTIEEKLNFVNQIPYVSLTLKYEPAQGIIPSYYRIYKKIDEEWVFQGTSTALSFVWGDSILTTDESVIGVNQVFSVVGASSNGSHIEPQFGRQAQIVPTGDKTIPDAPDYFVVEDTAENFRRFWWGYKLLTEPSDIKGFVIKYTRSLLDDWASASSLHDGQLLNPPFEIRALPSGAQKVMIRAVDTSNNLSESSTVIDFTMGDRPTQNVLFTKSLAATPWAGNLVSGSVDATAMLSGILSADTTTSGDMWSILDTTLMWTVNSSLMWQSPNALFDWAEEVVVPVGGITTLDWAGGGEVNISYAKGVYPDDFIFDYAYNEQPTFNTPYDLEDASFVNNGLTVTPNYAVARNQKNEAFLLDETSTTSSLRIATTAAIVNQGVHSVTLDLKKDSDDTKFPFLYLASTGGSGNKLNGIHFNTSTGEYSHVFNSGTTTTTVNDKGDYWQIHLTILTVDTINVTFYLYPANASGAIEAPVSSNTVVRSVVAWGVALKEGGDIWEGVGSLNSLDYNGTGQGIIPYTSPIHLEADTYTLLINSPISVDVNTLTKLDWITDVPDINEYFEDYSVTTSTAGPNSGMVITLTKTFIKVTNVSMVLQGGTAVVIDLLAKTPTTIEVAAYSDTARTTRVAATVDIRVQGY